MALGESDFSHWDRHFGFEATRPVLQGFDAILSVSEENKANCSSLYGVPESRINVVPNAIDTSVFTTVDRATAPRYYRLIELFGDATGVPVILNTSFNLKGEPIVNTPREAFRTFSLCGMDSLIFNHYLIEKD